MDPDFWNNPDEARRVERAVAGEQSWLDAWDDIARRADDIRTLVELAAEEEADLGEEIRDEATEKDGHVQVQREVNPNCYGKYGPAERTSASLK
ncbi:MAG: hypothetical protein R3178_10285, partial [Rhodothermales bacterium]|nr:hypothetical protein [Rhodothermales bacterium]